MKNPKYSIPRIDPFIATCGPLDIDDPQPAITVMMPDEDSLLPTANIRMSRMYHR